MRLAFVGDIALGDHPKTVGFGFRSRYRDGISTELVSRLVPPGGTPDVFFGNLEFPLGFPGSATGGVGEIQCRGSDAFVQSLVAAGITALNVATNHSAQHGPRVFRETIDCIKSSGIHVIGTPADFTEQGCLDVGGNRVAMLGWCDRPRQYSSEAPPYNEFSEAAFEQITAARRRADVVVASIHWGDEFILVPSDRERRIARAMISAGATFVIGHHPHVLREVEQYGDGLIAYSLGNFIGDMTWDPRNRLTGWLTAQVEASRITSWDFVSARIDDDCFPRRITDRLGLRRMEKLVAARQEHGARVVRRGYAAIAEAERRRHVAHTAWMMLRNAHRYPRGMALDVFGGALAHRLKRVLGSVASRGQPTTALMAGEDERVRRR